MKQPRMRQASDELTIEIVDSPQELQDARIARQYDAYQRNWKQMTRAAQLVRETNADRLKHRFGGIAQWTDLGPEFPDDARRLLR